MEEVRLVLLGSSRNSEDEKLINSLRNLSADLGVSHRVDFVINSDYSTVRDYLGRASVGIHTMWNEHFGISVVEFMLAGVLMVAHNSGGPKMDILKHTQDGQVVGYLAETVEGYAKGLQSALSLREEDMLSLRERARREAVCRFDDKIFTKNICKEINLLLNKN